MTTFVDGVDIITADLQAWRHAIHAHPETAFEEFSTAELVASNLASFGLEVHRGLAGTGIVGVLENGPGPMIGLRADMDALHVHEANAIPWRSQTAGKMHACGHDGHTAMLLGAARLLAQARERFSGTVVFIFQPAEENEGGARVMIEQGLFDRFPVEAVYGLHNWPGLPAGHIAAAPGPLMAAFDTFELLIHGRGAHGAMPNAAADPVVAAAHVVTALQSIVSRNADPADAAVVSVTQLHAGDTWNVIPQTAVLRGTTRSFRPEVRDLIERRMTEIAESVCIALGVRAELRYQRRYPALINTEGPARIARQAATDVVGNDGVLSTPVPSMTAEDFAFMLQHKPGCYVWLGNGSDADGRNLHSPRYDFNDEVLPIGVSYWVRLVQTALPPRQSNADG